MPVSIIGTFAGMYVLGFSINILTLFAMVLSIGMVVDDAIIVVENVERLMATGLSVRKATAKAMHEVTRPVIAVVLVLSAVFIPVAFMGGLAGVMYKQFAITIVISVVLSGIVALTFTPALCMLLLKKSHKEEKAFFHRGFNRGFEFLTHGYIKGVKFILGNNIIAVLLYVLTIVGIVLLFMRIPTGLVPEEDQGAILGVVQLPDGASIDRSSEFIADLTKKLNQERAIDSFMTLAGLDILSGSVRPNMGAIFIDLISWDQRKSDDMKSDAIVKKLYGMGIVSPEAAVFAFNPPPIPGMGATGGFEMWIENRIGDSTEKLYQYAMQIV